MQSIDLPKNYGLQSILSVSDLEIEILRSWFSEPLFL